MESQHPINMQRSMRRWVDCSSRWQIIPYQPTISQALDLLYSWYELGLSYSVIWENGSAISATVEIPGIPKVVSRFLNGIFFLSSLQRRYTKVRDVNKVLSYLESLEPNGSFKLKQLTLKTEETTNSYTSVVSTWISPMVRLSFM